MTAVHETGSTNVLWRWRSKAQDDDGHIISLIFIACDVYLLCLLYDSRSTFRSPCSEAISAYSRLFKFNPSILLVQNWLAPVVCERRAYHTRSSCGVSAQRTVATMHTPREHLYLEI